MASDEEREGGTCGTWDLHSGAYGIEGKKETQHSLFIILNQF